MYDDSDIILFGFNAFFHTFSHDTLFHASFYMKF